MLDGELLVFDHPPGDPQAGRLAFDQLQHRARLTATRAANAARRHPAHVVVFDLLRLDGVDCTRLPYARRRATLEALFERPGLGAP
ncbi:hypothetical protein [Streptomyces sp. NRRL S-495]|uniref:ATP-dependent DNA ligase n=1 Tax=Streptomyces sp. NRRL S-495 TaxID=1609133 RepID=UPI00336A53E3